MISKLTSHIKKIDTYTKYIGIAVCAVFVIGFALVGTRQLQKSHAASPGGPSSPPAEICGDSSLLNNGPSTAPAGAVTVPAGDDSTTPMSNGNYIDINYEISPNTTYWFASGIHTMGTGQFAQIVPAAGDTFIGAPGAIINGQGDNDSAFDGTAANITIQYLTVENFIPGADAIAVNHDTGPNWTIEYNTIKDNTGAGVGLGSNDVVDYNCLTDNDQYGFNAEGGSSDITLSNNEISSNDTSGTFDESSFVVSYSVASNVATIVTRAPMNLAAGDQINIGASGQCNFGWCTNLSLGALNGVQTITEVSTSPLTTSFQFDVTAPNVGVTSDPTATVSDYDISEGGSGAGKFWDTSGADVTDNYVHDNGDTGFWLDTDNTGFNISGNYISHNWSDGLIYEISYNGSVENNTFIDNAWGSGPSPNLGGFPDSAAYINSSGGDSNVPLPAAGFGYQGTSLLIENNDFTDNWGGVVLYENSNRACSLSSDNYCTLVNTNTYTIASCAQNLPGSVINGTRSAYAVNCRWKTQNATVSNNDFDFTPSNIGSDCTTAAYCGFNGLFSTGGSTPGEMDSVGFTGESQYTGSTFSVASTPSTLTVSSTESCGGQTVQNAGETCFAPGSPTAYINIDGDVFSYTGVTATTFTGVSYDSSVSTGPSSISASGYNVFQYWPPGANYPYAGNAIPNQVSSYQNNTFSDNAYCASGGSWNFVGFAQGNSMTQSQWTSGVSNVVNSGDNFGAQDSGSTFSSTCNSNNSPPTVTISSPSVNAEAYTKTFSVDSTSTANNGGSISSSQLLVNNTAVQTINAAPYNFTLDTLNYPDGSYTLTVQSTDNQGDVGSSSVTVYISNGDLNLDGHVNISDLAIMAANWNKTGQTYSEGDINGDGTVNIQDLAILASNWGWSE